MDEKQHLRKLVFDQELLKLKQGQFVSEEDYEKVDLAYKKYYEGLQLQTSTIPSTASTTQAFAAGTAQAKTAVSTQPIATRAMQPKPPVQPKKKLSPQEVRERNISWILILGVVFVLMSGVILATSSWESMNNAFKTTVISLVAALFFGISVIAEKLLKIKKTSFAFWILGSLFLPVAVLSAGYFKLFGSYFSIMGEGRYLLGAIGALICLPVYLYSSRKYNNRLFVWISLITLSSEAAFIIASLKQKSDVFYLGMVLYNGLILVLYHKLKENKYLKLFTSEVPVFAQVNLVLTTLFMLLFFNNAVFYGFNVLATAILFIFMVYSQNRKEYIYVFSFLVVYGVFQITENSFLSNFDLLIYAFIGLLFVALENLSKEEESMQKIFNYTNGVISGLAFIYISLQGILMRESSSIILLFAYLVISLNYLYLANKTKRVLFSYLTPIFLVCSAYQACKILKDLTVPNIQGVFMFGAALVMFGLLYYNNIFKYLQIIKKSSFITSLIVMILGILFEVYNMAWRYTGNLDWHAVAAFVELIFFGLVFYVLYKSASNKAVRGLYSFMLPISWLLGIYVMCMEIAINTKFIYHMLKDPYPFFISVIVIFILGYLWQWYDKDINTSFYYVGHVLMPLTIIPTLVVHPHKPYAFIAMAVIYLYSLFKSSHEWKTAFLYASFTTGILSFVTGINALYNLTGSSSSTVDLFGKYVSLKYSLPVSALIIAVLWFCLKDAWKDRTAYYLIPFSFVSSALLLFIHPAAYVFLLLLIIYISMVIYVLQYYKLQILNILPLGVFLVGINLFLAFSFKDNYLIISIVLMLCLFGVKFIGERLQVNLYGMHTGKNLIPVYFDWFALASLVLSYELGKTLWTYMDYSQWFRLTTPILFVWLVYSQIKRLPKGLPQKITKTATVLSLLIPYYTFISILGNFLYSSELYKLFKLELMLLPWLLLATVISTRLWSEHRRVTSKIEMIIIIIIALLLCGDLPGENQLKEGLILGILSLGSILGGMQFKKKSFFFAGSGVLIFNMLVQTKDFWGNLPWWIYLLLAGLILIGTASLHEIQKNKQIIKLDKKTLINKFKEWD